MVQKIECFVDAAGGIHRSAVEAHRADMQHWLLATGKVNEASAGALADLLVENREKLFEMVSMLESIARDTGAADE